MINTKEFIELCYYMSNAEKNINSYRKNLIDVDSKINELKSKNLSRDETLAYLSYKAERKELGNKIRNLKKYKKETAKKISEYENNYIDGVGLCYRKVEFIQFNGDNINDVFKFSHSTDYVFENETLTIFGKKNLFINVGEILVFDGEYHVYDEETFNESFTNNVGNCSCCECC